MNNKNFIFPIVSIVVAIIFLANMLFVVEQTEQAVIFQFGQPVKEKTYYKCFCKI